MPFASILMDDSPKFRWDAFVDGLQRIGFCAIKESRQAPGPSDILVCWNRHRHNAVAAEYAAVGRPVIVAENGYIGKDPQGRQLYALARDHHNGAGRWFVGEEDRWAALGLAVAPWRRKGRNILVLPQRGIGAPGVAMPANWPDRVVGRLRSMTKRNVIVREHPGLNRPSLKPDLADCFAAVTWGSGAAIKALVAGVPVFHEMPNWIGAPAARYGIDQLEDPALSDRAPMLHRLSYAQWTVDEIATGLPFQRLLGL